MAEFIEVSSSNKTFMINVDRIITIEPRINDEGTRITLIEPNKPIYVNEKYELIKSWLDPFTDIVD